MRRRWLVLGLILLLVAAVTAIFLRDLVREWIVEPLIWSYHFLRPLFGAVPQQVYWAFFLWLALFFAARSLLRGQERAHQGGETVRPPTGRVSLWREWLERAAGRSAYRGFFRWRLARNLAELAAQVMEYSEGLGGEAALQAGTKADVLPPEVQSCLQAVSGTADFGRVSPLRRLFRSRRRGSPLDLDPERVVRFLEDQMEGNYGGRDR